ncbi:hypothetical protein PPYR_01599 [Photinus pyralis]|uniref:Uncharacterized protein n=1 Tax=Photinus pyralis TaxID=7054 RepID=A0A5N4A1I3_PHOPY|nr:hypothetical protein PPYR_02928 [Photinus pyralis]KAB0804629.1 hypothetical protein PPYR_01599 [Photinus pyralis]
MGSNVFLVLNIRLIRGSAEANLTVMFTFSSSGTITPPMVIYLSKRRTVDNIVKATTCLHNFIRQSTTSRKHYCPPNYVDTEEGWRQKVESSIIETCIRLGSNNAAVTSNVQRNNLAKYFTSPPGFKKGQIEYVKRI